MLLTMKIVLILFGLAYLISPVDIIPDLLLPWVGWIDDGVILWSIYYLIRYGELPWFLFKKREGGSFSDRPAGPGPGPERKSNRNTQQATSRTAGKNQSQKNQSQKKQDTGKSKATDTKTGASNGGKFPHDILGVRKTASWPEIQTAYKEKIKQYHPDKLSHLGDEFANLANEKFLEIQAAYEKLKENNRP